MSFILRDILSDINLGVHLYYQVLRILGNIAYNGPGYCIQLMQEGLLSVLCATLKMADPDIVTLSLEVLHLLIANSPQVRNTHTRKMN